MRPPWPIPTGAALGAPAAGWEKRWTKSDWKKSDGTAGEWEWTAGDW